MAGVKKSTLMQSKTVVNSSPAKLPESGMVDIIFKGEVKNVSVQLAKTLIDKGAAKLKV